MLQTPLLNSSRRRASLMPLYVVTLLQAVGFCVAKLPAFSLRFQEFAADSGMGAAETASSFGRLSALRSLIEFFATPTLAAGSDRVGRKKVLILCCVALLMESLTLATTRSLLTLCATHVFFGLFADSNGALEGSCIADATEPGPPRAVAFGRLLFVVGASMVIGPAIGGELAARSGAAPFVGASLVFAVSLTYMVCCLPEYLPPGRRAEIDLGAAAKIQGPGMMVKSFAKMLQQSRPLIWYIMASALSSMATGVVGSTQALWAKESFGWDGRMMGLHMSIAGLCLMGAQAFLLPPLLRIMAGHEAELAQLCYVLYALKLAAYGLAPSGFWVNFALVVSTPSYCCVAVLRSLMSRCAGESQQGLLAGGSSALGTAASVIGALAGSHALAVALQEGLPLGTPVFLGAVCMLLSAVCVAAGARMEKVALRKQRPSSDLPEAAKGM